jgi:hypothetical protein
MNVSVLGEKGLLSVLGEKGLLSVLGEKGLLAVLGEKGFFSVCVLQRPSRGLSRAVMRQGSSSCTKQTSAVELQECHFSWVRHAGCCLFLQSWLTLSALAWGSGATMTPVQR